MVQSNIDQSKITNVENLFKQISKKTKKIDALINTTNMINFSFIKLVNIDLIIFWFFYES